MEYARPGARPVLLDLHVPDGPGPFPAAMHKVGAGCELITVEGGGHGMSGWRAPEMLHWETEMIAWLQKTMHVN